MIHPILSLVLTLASHLQSAEAPELKVRSISLFKNGLAHVELGLRVPAGSTSATIGLPSTPLHGSLWTGEGIGALATEMVTTTESQPVKSLAELLEANVGARMRVAFASGEATGELVSFETGGGGAPGLLLLRTDSGLFARTANQVQEVVLLGENKQLERSVDSSETRLRARLEPATKDRSLKLEYLTRGLAWAPSYRLELGKDGSARIVARADLINDAFDLTAVDVHLVSGYPNLRFSDVPGVLALTRTLEQFLQALGAPAQSAANFTSNFLTTQNILGNAYSPFDNNRHVEVEGGGLAGVSVEDMFRTSLGLLDLEKGGRSTHPLFRAEIPCEQFYRWEVSDYLDSNGYYRGSEEVREEVWHTLRLDNTTNSPWTTGPIMVFSEGALVGQDVSYYTSSGGSSLVKVTKALDLRAEESEVEVSRTQEPDRIWGNWYDRVHLKGMLIVRNHKPHTVKVEIVKTLSGDVTRVDGEPKDVALARGLRQINTMHELCWEQELEGESELRLEYEYDVLVRR